MKQEKQTEDFFQAANDNDLETVKKLISEGLSPDVRDDDDETLLASWMRVDGKLSEHIEITNYLIQNSADINHISAFGISLLHVAAQSDMISTATLLLKRGIDPEIKTESGHTAIFGAQSADMLNLLIAHNAGSLDDTDDEGNNLLHNAVGPKPNLAIVRYLANKIDINSLNHAGNTALIEALYFDFFPEEVEATVDCLINSGANVNLAGKNGHSALQVAVRNKKLGTSIIRRLVDADTDIHQEDDYGLQAIHFTAASNLDYLKFLINKGADLNAVSAIKKETPLSIATQYNNKMTVEFLLSNDADSSLRDVSEKTALNHALEGDFSDIVFMLIKSSAIATTQDEIMATKENDSLAENNSEAVKVTSLITALQSGTVEQINQFFVPNNNGVSPNIEKVSKYVINNRGLDVFIYLVEKQKLDINKKDGDGYTLLHDAVYYNNIEIAKYLIEHGISINSKADNGETVYSMTSNSSPEMVELLVDLGVDIDREKEGRMATSALENQNTLMTKYFTNMGYELDTELFNNEDYLMDLIQHQNDEILSFLFNNKLDVDKRISIYGEKATLLHVAVMIEADELVVFLLSKGANPNARNTADKAIFEHALNDGNMTIIKALYENNADINDAGRNKLTPLLMALDLKRIDLVNYFIEKNSDVNLVTDREKNSALHLAAAHGYLDAIKRMIKKGGNVNQLNKARKAPLDLAIENEQMIMQEYLTEMEKIST